MDRSNQMRKQIAVMRQSLFDQGFLDEQFIKLEDLQDDANPNFVEEVATEIHLDSSITWTKHSTKKKPVLILRLKLYLDI
ncbi:pseudo histidine-containing phosphotransfer protein 2-like [Humulus lupulus]|uniref:pseudo histidine-containing phosphotransfer protein 2-like n=1 Tax=Humulus lupulus TaxID=3486 RepID=UPI002B4171B6|nr:pseudo histidine-containing phosphotransfer protein 2-like [Humulus lupulus]